MKYYLNGWEEGLSYILNSTDAVIVRKTDTEIYFKTKD